MPLLEVGYTIFSNEGPQGLKIEALAREVGKSKSSFYHCFADLDIFIDEYNLASHESNKDSNITSYIFKIYILIHKIFHALFNDKTTQTNISSLDTENISSLDTENISSLDTEHIIKKYII